MALGLIAGATNAHADTDVGATAADEQVTASLVLKVRNPDLLEAYVASTQIPFSFTYHHFLSLKEFVATFSPSDRDINSIKQYLAQNGITVTEIYADKLILKVNGPASAFDKVFSADLRDVQDSHGRRHHRPHHHTQIPRAMKDILVEAVGLDNSTDRYVPHHVDGRKVDAKTFSWNRLTLEQTKPLVLPAPGVIATQSPGDYTVGDFAELYNVTPLYANNINGQGRTVGIATLAGFDPADAYQYWDLIGLVYKPNRITQVHVDGGGEVTAAAGAGETCLDVEMSGGLAPQANVVVYDAQNTEAGFIDVFYKAASDNLVDTLSVSWGEAEVFYNAALNDGVDFTGELVAFHQAFLELAAQGTSTFASSGDAGAYEANRFANGLGEVLSIGAPASDPAIVSAGGTTVPAVMDFGFDGAPLTIEQEQVWGWDYLDAYFSANGVDIHDELFPAGGGGGVSIFWPRPWYQYFTPGIRNTEPNQQVTFDPGDGTGAQLLYKMPANFAGRNMPDLSAKADPETGYLYYSTTDGGLLDFGGGTSFVAPQFNGMTALLVQANGGRLGLMNPMLYRFAQQHHTADNAPFVDITAGDD
ncbi:MAG TPA: S53 family peptidase, partial [Kofleriaceae bacterium]